MCSAKTPALKSGRRRGKEVNYEGQIVRVERRRGSRSSTSATDLGTRMVTRGRKKLMEASVREAGHHGGESASTVDVDVVESRKLP
ncbi:reverse transcriptase family protein, partial [Trichinella spiralis]|uniref:reverse transcriptase family protein n=1 Tax=Trichinella spiralis TaxID=6334 RepID=UPI0001EFD2FF